MFSTRRAVLAAGLASVAVPSTASAQGSPPAPDWLRSHSAFAAWDAPQRPLDRVLATRIEPDPGAARISLRDWLGGRPTVLAIWATWCAPCLVEKRPEAQLNARLQAANSRAQVKALLAYDDANLETARARLVQLGAAGLVSARATDAAEQSLLWVFGFDRDRRSAQRTRTTYAQLSTVLPFTLLIDANGGLLGRSTGVMRDAQRRSYWEQLDTLDMMLRLGSS